MIVLSVIRTVFTAIVVFFATTIDGLVCIIAGILHVEDRPGGIYDRVLRRWSRICCWAAGIKLVIHNPERLAPGKPRIFIANHLSWFDIPVLTAILPRSRFVAKSELFKIPIFGGAIAAAGMVPIERQNRKAAFAAYRVAAERIHEGSCVVVFPEGTRGYDYPIRPFKKGPFVLAIAAQAPIIPVLIYGARDVLKRGEFLVHSGPVHVHLLEPVPTEGLDYPDRDELAERVRSRIADELASCYGIESERDQGQPEREMADTV